MQFGKGNFSYDNIEGKVGEGFCLSYLKSKNPEDRIFDVSDVRIFQLLDIDFVLAKTDEACDTVRRFISEGQVSGGILDEILKSEDVMTIEVKTDTRTCGLHPTGNVLFEVVSHRSPGTYNTRARYVFYICSRETGEFSGVFDISAVYIIDMWKLREWHLRNHDEYNKSHAYDENIDYRFPISRLVSDKVASSLPEAVWEGWHYNTKDFKNGTGD